MIYGENIKLAINMAAANCNRGCYIASAYCKSQAFEELLLNASIKAKVKVLFVRWELRDLISGASDLEVYELAKQDGWRVYINQQLHAKVYRFDDACYIGSANLTNKGITGHTGIKNIETLSLENFNQDIENWFSQLTKTSIPLDDELYSSIKRDVRMYEEIDEPKPEYKYSLETINLLSNLSKQPLFTSDLFWVEDPELLIKLEIREERNVEHDLQLLRLYYPVNQDDVTLAFHRSKIFHWLLNILLTKEEIYFGELTSLLHNALMDDPIPYRHTIKGLLNNLINWIVYCSDDVINVDKPNHSTRLSLRKSLI